MEQDENTTPDSRNESIAPDEAREMFAMLSVPELRQKPGQEKVDEAMNALLGFWNRGLRMPTWIHGILQ